MAITASHLFVNNPLMRRYRFSQLRLSQIWIYLTIYAAIVILLLFMNYNIRQARDEGGVVYRKLYNDLYYQFVALESLIVVGWAAFNSRAAIRQEGLDKTYDFFRLFPFSAMQKVIGIMIGRSLMALILGIFTMALIVVLGILGKVSTSLQLQAALLLFSGWLFSSSTALLSSGPARRAGRSGPGAWIILFIGLGITTLFAFMASLSIIREIRHLDALMIKFYTFDIRVLVLTGLIVLYFAVWSILGLIRRFTHENEALFNRRGAIIFLIGYEALALGLFWPHLPRVQTAAYGFWLVTLLPVCLVPLASVKTFDYYMEGCGLIRGRSGRGGTAAAALFYNSNLTLGAALFVIWAAGAILAVKLGPFGSNQYLFDVCVVLSFCLFLMLLLEIYALYVPIFAKLGLLMIFTAVLDIFLFIIIGATIKNYALLRYSLFGFFAHLLNPMSVKTIEYHRLILVLNLALCIVPAAMVVRRYAHVLSLRKRMQ